MHHRWDCQPVVIVLHFIGASLFIHGVVWMAKKGPRAGGAWVVAAGAVLTFLASSGLIGP